MEINVFLNTISEIAFYKASLTKHFVKVHLTFTNKYYIESWQTIITPLTKTAICLI